MRNNKKLSTQPGTKRVLVVVPAATWAKAKAAAALAGRSLQSWLAELIERAA